MVYVCPECGHTQDDSGDCPECGIALEEEKGEEEEPKHFPDEEPLPEGEDY